MTSVFRDFVDAVYSRNDYYRVLMERDRFCLTGPTVRERVRTLRGKERARFLIGALWNSVDIMPSSTCSTLDLPQGSSYAKGARRLMDTLSDTINVPSVGYFKAAAKLFSLEKQLGEEERIPLSVLTTHLGCTPQKARSVYSLFLKRRRRAHGLIERMMGIASSF